MGSYFRGRGLDWDPDKQAIELERQRWVYENVNRTSEIIAEVVRDPDELYRLHREQYERTGSMTEFRLMLEYVHG